MFSGDTHQNLSNLKVKVIFESELFVTVFHQICTASGKIKMKVRL